ncbi:MAG TPA: serine hydrolase, partial [Herpetosiphonaceae bacterium]
MDSPPTCSAHSNRLPYIPGLDGLRALSVIVVLLYHAGLPVQGGFLGVESFFVLSGFLITGLLLAEWRQHRRIDLRAFWLRRARRLFPALLVMLLGTVLLDALLLRGERSDLGADLLAGLGYVMNWHLIARGQSYFDPLLRPSLVQHLWSLAVEEQFYILWPLIFVAGMRMLRARGLLMLIVAAALGSAALMAAAYQPGADPSRLYYGTDTRASGVLVGAALALVWAPLTTPAIPRRRGRWLPDAAGLAALAGLIVCFVFLSERHPLLYRGGFALIDLLTALLIAAVTHPHAQIVPRWLGSRPLRWIGLRSYGFYLWHWPVFMVTRPTIDLPLAGLPLLGLRLAIVAVLVELSYRWIELPVRHGLPLYDGSRWWGWRGAWSAAWLSRSRRGLDDFRRLRLLVPILLLLTVGVASFGRTSPNSAARPAVPPTTASRRITAASTTVALPTAPAKPDPQATAAPPARTPTPAPVAPQPLDPALIAQMQAVLDDTVTSGSSPGAVLAVSIPGYTPWSGASGVADRRDGRPMEADTLIRISSITKMFTAVVVLQLAEEGRIDLDTPISAWLPEIVPLADRTTVRHLLSHRSGIFDYLEDSEFFIEAYQNPERTYTPRELVGMVDQYGAAFEPGSAGAWKYSSTNYIILGLLVEQVTGRLLAEEMRQRIMTPLDLRHTFFTPDEAVDGAIAEGYIGASDRADVSMTFVYATGNLVSTADDLRRFAA